MKNDLHSLGFSHVELLIAVALMALVGAIAISETVISRTRSDVARVRMDIRRVALALEAYQADQAAYPIINAYAVSGIYGQYNRGPIEGVWGLTTPVAYLKSVSIRDPFGQWAAPGVISPETATISYVNVRLFNQMRLPPAPLTPANRPLWYLISLGPDRVKGPNAITGVINWMLGDYASKIDPDGTCHFDSWQYDPSNGTVSNGDILSFQWR